MKPEQVKRKVDIELSNRVMWLVEAEAKKNNATSQKTLEELIEFVYLGQTEESKDEVTVSANQDE